MKSELLIGSLVVIGGAPAAVDVRVGGVAVDIDGCTAVLELNKAGIVVVVDTNDCVTREDGTTAMGSLSASILSSTRGVDRIGAGSGVP